MLIEFLNSHNIELSLELVLYGAIALFVLVIILTLWLRNALCSKEQSIKQLATSEEEYSQKLQDLDSVNRELLIDNTEKTIIYDSSIARMEDFKQQIAGYEKQLVELQAKDKNDSEVVANFSNILNKSEAKSNLKEKELQKQRIANQDLQFKVVELEKELLTKNKQSNNLIDLIKEDCTTKIENLKKEQDLKIQFYDNLLKTIKEEHQQQLHSLEVKYISNIDTTARTYSAQFNELSVNGLNSLLNPFQQQLEELKRELLDSQQVSKNSESMLQQMIVDSQHTSNELATQAKYLIRSLKGNKGFSGNWLESNLKDLLDSCGLIEGVNYSNNAIFKYLKPDQSELETVVIKALVNLPNRRSLKIDSFNDLQAYSALIQANDSVAINQALHDLTQSLEAHAQKLITSFKHFELSEQAKMVLLYVPIESALQAVLDYKPGFYQQLLEQNICLVSNSSLLPIINMIDLVWNNQLEADKINNFANRSQDLLNSVKNHSNNLNSLGEQLTNVVNSYNEISQGFNGNQGLAEQFNKLDAAAQDAIVSQIEKTKLVDKKVESSFKNDELDLIELDDPLLMQDEEKLVMNSSYKIKDAFTEYEDLFEAINNMK